jgi:hypothetical protein
MEELEFEDSTIMRVMLQKGTGKEKKRKSQKSLEEGNHPTRWSRRKMSRSWI